MYHVIRRLTRGMNKRATALVILATFTLLGHAGFAQQSGSVQAQSGQVAPALPARPYVSRAPSPEHLKFLDQFVRKHTHLPGPRLPGSGVINPAAPSAPATTPMAMPSDQSAAPLAPGDAVLFANTAFGFSATNGSTSTIGEPSVGNTGAVVFQSGNWYASLSLDDGQTFTFVDPYNTFPASDGGFCCDQIVAYDPSRDLILWLLQYVQDANRNRLRLAVAKGLDTLLNGTANWWYYDFTPDDTFGWTGQWFDFPNLSVGNNYLYLTSNVYTIIGETFTRTAILRLPLDPISTQMGLSFDFFADTTRFNFRVAQGITQTAYWGVHNSTSSLRIYSWDEGSSTINLNDTTITAWNDAVRTCPGPDGRDWCGRAQGKILGAAVANGVITFVWSASQGGGFPFPYVDVAQFSAADGTLLGQPMIWNPNYAWIYPAVSPNDRGHLGISIFYGGGPFFPAHAVGLIDDFAGPPGAFLTTQTSSQGPNTNVWGDYVTVRPHSPDRLLWSATGYTLQGGGDNANSVPQYVVFGRSRDSNAVTRWSGR